jgi:hypothetical protein
MKRLLCLTLIHFLVFAAMRAQSPPASSGAANSVQLAQPEPQQSGTREFKIPAGTPLEIETAYTVDSEHVRSEDLISFRVLVPIKIDGVTLIEKYSLVTGRVVEAKRGQHWGRAGKLSWIMQDVVAVDLTRVPLHARNDSTDAKNAVKGTSHAGQVATEMIVFGGFNASALNDGGRFTPTSNTWVSTTLPFTTPAVRLSPNATTVRSAAPADETSSSNATTAATSERMTLV